MKFNEQLEWKTLSDCEEAAVGLARTVQAGESIGLQGDLGAGKTTFLSYFVKALGSTDPVSSPTFVLQHEYKGDGICIEHWDVYRLSEMPEELLEPVSAAGIRCIEWVDKFTELLSQVDILITISLDHIDDRAVRKVTVERCS